MSTMLVGNNIALVAFTTLISGSFAWLIGPTDGGMLTLLGETVILTLIVLVFGEYLPKTLFRLYADDALYLLAIPLRALQWLLYLPSLVMTGTSNALLSLFFKRPAEELDTVLTRLDLEKFVNESRVSADEDTIIIDTKLFGNALNLSEVRVSDCMVPRTEIQSMDVSATIDELEQKFQETRLSRILIIDGDIDQVLGYVHHQQLLKLPEKRPGYRDGADLHSRSDPGY